MSENRKERSLETRATEERVKSWQRPETLPMPEDRPGYIHRYIRVSNQGEHDPSNISMKLREGWEPCVATEYPEIDLALTEMGRYKDNIVIGGLMLCRAPIELMQQRSTHFNEQVNRQMQAVDADLMRQNNPKMPLFANKRSDGIFGTGT